MRVLDAYFQAAGEVTAANAWEHVYRCLLWVDQAAGLAHVYDSNHNGEFGLCVHGPYARHVWLRRSSLNLSIVVRPIASDNLS